jgi:hypothetical protein
VGHSWVNDPVQVTILLSHLAPRLETLKWFHEKNRPGYVEANAKGWQQVSDNLPHLQKLRLWERQASTQIIPVPPKSDKIIDATVKTVDRGVMVKQPTQECAIQFSPSLVSRMVEAKPTSISMAIDATPSTSEIGVLASPSKTNQSVGVSPSVVSIAVGSAISTTDKSTEAVDEKRARMLPNLPAYFVLPMVYGLLSLAHRVLVSYPLYYPLRIMNLLLATLHARRTEVHLAEDMISEKSHSSSSSPSSGSDSPVRT